MKEYMILNCCCIDKKTIGSKLVAQNVQRNGNDSTKIGQFAAQNGKGTQTTGNQGMFW